MFAEKMLVLLIKEYETAKSLLDTLEFKIQYFSELEYVEESLPPTKKKEYETAVESWPQLKADKEAKYVDLYYNMKKVFNKYVECQRDSFVDGWFITRDTNSNEARDLWSFIRSEYISIMNDEFDSDDEHINSSDLMLKLNKFKLLKEIYLNFKNDQTEDIINKLLDEYNLINEDEDEAIGDAYEDLDFHMIEEMVLQKKDEISKYKNCLDFKDINDQIDMKLMVVKNFPKLINIMY